MCAFVGSRAAEESTFLGAPGSERRHDFVSSLQLLLQFSQLLQPRIFVVILGRGQEPTPPARSAHHRSRLGEAAVNVWSDTLEVSFARRRGQREAGTRARVAGVKQTPPREYACTFWETVLAPPDIHCCFFFLFFRPVRASIDKMTAVPQARDEAF